MSDTLKSYRAVIAIDFEFREAAPHSHAHPVCMVAEDLTGGQVWRAWLDDGDPMPVLPTGDDVLYVSYSAPAEWSCYLPLGIELPPNILDLYAWHRQSKNGFKEAQLGKKTDPATGQPVLLSGKPAALKCSLLRLMDEQGLAQLAMDADSKKEMRELIMRGGPYSPDEKQSILDYCEWDVRDLKLVLPKIVSRPDFDLQQQLFLGDFTRVLAWVDYNGIPVDVGLCGRLTKHWVSILRKFVATMEAKHGFKVTRLDGNGRPTLNQELYERFIAGMGHAEIFPKTKQKTGSTKSSGRFSKSVSKNRKAQPNLRTFAEQHREEFPAYAGLLELVDFLSSYKQFTPPIGSDGRWRAGNAPWVQTTGRVSPRGTHIFRMHAYFRYLITHPARALAYVDLKAAEYGIGAALSGDRNMMGVYMDVVEGRTEKPYLVTGKKIGILPPDATSKHPLYKKCKSAELAMSYGQTIEGCVLANNIPYQLAEDFHLGHRALYATYWAYTEFRCHEARAEKMIRTPYGYSMHVHPGVTPNSLLNWPMQATCAEILRIASARMLDEGLSICCTVHDAVLIEADPADIDRHTAVAQMCWRWASERVLGFALDSDAKIIRPGQRYEDDDGTEDWNQLMKWLGEAEDDERTLENESEVRDGLPVVS